MPEKVNNSIEEQFIVTDNDDFILFDKKNKMFYNKTMLADLVNRLAYLEKINIKKDFVVGDGFASGYFEGMEHADKWAIDRILKYAEKNNIDGIGKLIDSVYSISWDVRK